MRSCDMNSTGLLLYAVAAVTLIAIKSGSLNASSPAADEIRRLPGAEKLKITFGHYSGFLKASEKHFLHYWFVESQRSAANDPIIFWFNGGPGCSSLDGLLNEMGPYVINDDGATLRDNPNAWNKFASVVYIEAPAGVGYSYATDYNIKTDDDQTSTENYNAIKHFFTKFPSFRNHSVYIMGESYGGIYVPTLAARIIDGISEFPLNFKGIALGNGYVSEVLNIETSIRFAYGHGVVDEKLWITLENECCGGCADTCDFTHLKKAYCSRMVQDIFNFLWTGGLNPYDLYRDCNPNASASHIRLKAIRNGLTPLSFRNREKFEFDDLKQQPSGLYAHLKRHVTPSYGDAPCMNDSAMIQYMNMENVREALHIPSHIGKWDLCSEEVTTTYVKTYTDMTPFIRKLIGANVDVLLFYGDTDMACNFLMGQQFAANLQQPLRSGKQPWRFDDQIAGFKTVYQGLTFITVRGAGHMAAQWRAPQMQHAIQQFLLNEPI